MRQLFTLLVTGVMLSFIASCNKDDATGPDENYGDGNVQLRIVDANTGTRAYNGTEPAVDGEKELADKLGVFVYGDPGSLEYINQALSVNQTTLLSNTFKLNEGWKYFYIFSNADIQKLPGNGTGYEEFEKQRIRVSFENSVPITIARQENMTIGTLWRADDGLFENRKNIYGPYIGTPQRIDLNIGRAAAKVRLASVAKQTEAADPSPLLGTFSDQSYRLRSVANEYFLVGQLDNSGNYPPTTGLRYISAVHEEGPGTTEVPNHYYVDYFWEDAKTPSGTTHFYAVENTSKKMTTENVEIENLFYGNTTYVQLKTTYLPDDQEVYDPAAPTVAGAGGISAGDTYWSAIYNDNRLIFNADPTGMAGFSEVEEYEGGVMYYHFPIRDTRETGVENQCCVIRNHYYELAVTKIKKTG